MPRVPDSPVQRYGQTKVDLQPLAGAKLNSAPGPDVFGAQLGDVAERIGTSALSQIWTEQRQRSDQLEVLAADNQLQAWKAKRLYDPQTGALNVKGKDALGLQDAIRPEFDQMVGNIAGTLSNDNQRAAFQRAALATGQHLYETLLQHTDAEMKQYDTAETAKGIENAQNDGIANADTPQRVSDAFNKMTAIAKDYARANRLGPEATQALLDEKATQFHAGVIQQLLSTGNDRFASAYYEETKDQIRGAARPEIERQLETGSTLAESQRQSDAIMSAASSESDALDQVKAITDPKLRDAVQARVVQAWGLRRVAQRDATEQAMIGALNDIDQTHKLNPDPTMWAGLDAGQRDTLLAYAKRVAGGAGEPKTNYATFYDLSQMATDPSRRDEFLGTNLLNYRNQLSNGDLKHWMEVQGSARGKTDDSKVRAATIDKDLFDAAAQSAGLRPFEPRPTEAQKAQLGALHNAALQAIADAQQGSKAPLTREQKQEVVQKIVDQKVLVPGWFGSASTETAVTIVKPTDREGAYVPLAQIPTQNVNEFANYLRSTSPRAQSATTTDLATQYQQRMQRAYAAILMGLSDAEVKRRLEGR